jgi:hypothetical protein
VIARILKLLTSTTAAVRAIDMGLNERYHDGISEDVARTLEGRNRYYAFSQETER